MAEDRDGVVVEIATGTALSVPLRLTLRQEGFPELRHDARVPVAGGAASVPNIAVHLRVALGGRF